MPESARTDSPAVELSRLRFAWPRSAQTVLCIDELNVPRGSRMFIRGRSGSGKSTLLGLIGGVLAAGQGEVTVLGADLARMSAARRDRFRADNIGFVFQQFNLLPYLNVLDNILLAARFSRERSRRLGGNPAAAARRCLAALGLDDVQLLSRPVNELSVGQQQRVAVARGLLGEPGLVIADEPTSALDADTRGEFMHLLFSETARTGATLLFVSHDAELAAGFDRVIELDAINRVNGNPPCAR